MGPLPCAHRPLHSGKTAPRWFYPSGTICSQCKTWKTVQKFVPSDSFPSLCMISFPHVVSRREFSETRGWLCFISLLKAICNTYVQLCVCMNLCGYADNIFYRRLLCVGRWVKEKSKMVTNCKANFTLGCPFFDTHSGSSEYLRQLQNKAQLSSEGWKQKSAE